MLMEDDLWTLQNEDGQPVVPYDSNPGHHDEGMLVYRSEEAAESASQHQNEMYELNCKPCRLRHVLRVPCLPDNAQGSTGGDEETCHANQT